ncbi:MAG: flagellin FliC [Deltaproteobacteria bacterium]|nr:flagellin FliC [Deltaproteobacteria bacterium]
MSISIMTNTSSIQAQRHFAKSQGALASTMERLSSGLRINRAGDDAAGLAVASRLSAQKRGLTQAQRNANDAVSMIQTAEGGLNEMNNMLARMRELAVEASNGGTMTAADRQSLDDEYQALSSEIDRISDSTDYNGSKLLDGSLAAGVDFQVGVFNSATDRITVTAFSDADASALGLGGTSLTSQTNAQSAIDALDNALNNVSNQRGDLGAVQNRLATTMSNLGSMYENLSAALSRIMDADVAEETAAMTKSQILVQAGVSVLSQANQGPQVALSLLGR